LSLATDRRTLGTLVVIQSLAADLLSLNLSLCGGPATPENTEEPGFRTLPSACTRQSCMGSGAVDQRGLLA
jgi:hypothetical protein